MARRSAKLAVESDIIPLGGSGSGDGDLTLWLKALYSLFHLEYIST
ncbi:MAG: hypothetical protein II699_00470 [Lachnospiraceae bacterium]|nr:hypothetical protein [Lachnospiraceae bacterium]